MWKRTTLPCLAAVMLFGCAHVQEESPQMLAARRSQSLADLATYSAALDMFALDNGRYPTTAEGLSALVTRPAGAKDWRGPYVKRLSMDPWGHPYAYRFVDASHFSIASLGADGEAGGTGASEDIAELDD